MKIDQRKFRHLSVNSRRRRTGAALASLTVISLLGATAQAQIWIGAGGDDNWSTAENWSTPPATGSTIHFAGTLRPTPSYDLTDHLAYIGIVFDTGAAAFTLGGNSIIVTNVIENDSAVPQIVNMDVNQGGGGGAFLVRPVSGDLIFNGVISGTAQVQKNNNFTATFNGANTFTGPVSITGAGEGLKITSIRNVGGAPNSLGQPALANSVIQIGIAGQPSPALNYIGTGDTCDRVVNINTAALANGAMLKQSGTGLLKFTGGVTATDPAATQRRLFLDGSSSGTGEIAGNIAKAGGWRRHPDHQTGHGHLGALRRQCEHQRNLAQRRQTRGRHRRFLDRRLHGGGGCDQRRTRGFRRRTMDAGEPHVQRVGVLRGV